MNDNIASLFYEAMNYYRSVGFVLEIVMLDTIEQAQEYAKQIGVESPIIYEAYGYAIFVFVHTTDSTPDSPSTEWNYSVKSLSFAAGVAGPRYWDVPRLCAQVDGEVMQMAENRANNLRDPLEPTAQILVETIPVDGCLKHVMLGEKHWYYLVDGKGKILGGGDSAFGALQSAYKKRIAA